MAAARKGAICSWGASGSIMVVARKVNGHYKIFKVGPLSIFEEMSKAQVGQYEELPPANPDATPPEARHTIAAICGHAA